MCRTIESLRTFQEQELVRSTHHRSFPTRIRAQLGRSWVETNRRPCVELSSADRDWPLSAPPPSSPPPPRANKASVTAPQEIHGLLHMVAASDRQLPAVDPAAPISLGQFAFYIIIFPLNRSRRLRARRRPQRQDPREAVPPRRIQ